MNTVAVAELMGAFRTFGRFVKKWYFGGSIDRFTTGTTIEMFNEAESFRFESTLTAKRGFARRKFKI
jgi:hypothetical protein